MTIEIKASKRVREIAVSILDAEKFHQKGIENALFETGKEVVRDVRKLIKEGPKTGRIYTYRGQHHQASAPGEAPANRSGRLMRSSNYSVRNWSQMTVGETAEYAGFLEHGVRGRLRVRPHLIVAVNKNAIPLIQAIEDNVKRELEKPPSTIKRQRGLAGLK